MGKIKVTYKNSIVGYTIDEGKSIDFLDTKEAQEAKNLMFKHDFIGISSRKMGTVHENEIITVGDVFELNIVGEIEQNTMGTNEVKKLFKKK